jgi:hypothetical protein
MAGAYGRTSPADQSCYINQVSYWWNLFENIGRYTLEAQELAWQFEHQVSFLKRASTEREGKVPI